LFDEFDDGHIGLVEAPVDLLGVLKDPSKSHHRGRLAMSMARRIKKPCAGKVQ
jgi:hypothetical protein